MARKVEEIVVFGGRRLAGGEIYQLERGIDDGWSFV